MPVPFDQLLIGPALAVFGEATTYTPAAGQVFTLQGAFLSAYKTVEFQDGAAASTQSPALDVRLSDFPAGAPAPGDTVLVRGALYSVADVQPDGIGGAKLLLQLAA